MTAAVVRDAAPDCITFESALLSQSRVLGRFALRLTKDHAAAEDLVQDTLIRAWAARSRFESGSNMSAWLFRIARNLFLSGLRRTKRQIAWNPDRNQLMLAQAATQDDALYARDLRVALSRLPASQQIALSLVSWDSMSMVGAADRLGVPAGTVKSRVARARASILAYVDGESMTMDEGSLEAASAASHHFSADPIISPATNSHRPKRPRYEEWKASSVKTIG